MIFHPPILYMGYVGFSVAFAFAMPAAGVVAGYSLGALVASVVCGVHGCSSPRHRAGLGVGILRTGLGRLVVLGPGGKRLVYAVAGGNRADALTGGV